MGLDYLLGLPCLLLCGLGLYCSLFCGLLGLEPLYLACEGRLVMVCPEEKADLLIETLCGCRYTEGAAVIGRITKDMPGRVTVTTEIGAQTLLPQPGNELLPRIC